MLDPEAIASAAADFAAARPEVQSVFLFGSYARGAARPNSDVDIAMVLDPAPEPGDFTAVQSELSDWWEDRLGVPVDVVVVTDRLQPGLLFDIFRYERILFARDRDAAHGLAVHFRQEYRDLLPRLTRGLERVRIRLEAHADALK